MSRAQRFKVGPGSDPTVTHSPVVNQEAVVKVKSHVDNALAKSANLVYGGQFRDDLGKCYNKPTIITDVIIEMPVA